MVERRHFIKQTVGVTAGLSLAPSFVLQAAEAIESYERPLLAERRFRSKSVEATIERMSGIIKDEELRRMFVNCFPNTLDTTVTYSEKNGKPDTFVITGDIHAMWLRDSTAQVWPYLPLIKEDVELEKLIEGVVRRQSYFISIDPYANAFNDGATGSDWESDFTEMKPELHERKWEIDSLCYPIRLAYHYWKMSGNTGVFDKEWIEAMKLVVQTFKEQQRFENKGPYSFMRETEISTDTCPGRGWGNPAKPNGLICSAFRPSDDATTYLYLIPSNYFAVVSLRQLAEIFREVLSDETFAIECETLADQVANALEKYAAANHLDYGKILAFEIDGFGNRLYMDDANIPSLLSLPYLGGLSANDSLYQNTRKFILSEDNPWFWKGKDTEGIGGPHVGEYYIWPMAIIMRAMTSSDKMEISQCLSMLKQTHAGTGFMHETFHKDNPWDYTRSWFAWANTLFGELILNIEKKYPELLAKVY
ncbi:glycoside hydrolase family 125 protein [Draconibacterium orientale]|uniref:glycoside hydrolase family 125 protein n=1 Tax=Draconibacterium orientale TaxID=1168034 RepID=UPI002A0A698A|nr:glycoside hydrolase family 125 protein [Draconibacterium orientale]